MSLFIESMSDKRGTLCSVVLPSARRHAARIGNAEFLEPEISILPLRRFPPRMRKESIVLPVHGPGNRGSIAGLPEPERCHIGAGKNAPPDHSEYRPVH